MSAYDPADPYQRQRLETMAPGLTESKMDVYHQCAEQKEFIARCSIKLSITPDEYQRLVRILGGADRILVHPFDVSFNEAIVKASGYENSALIADMKKVASLFVGTSANEQTRGLFSFLTPTVDGVGGMKGDEVLRTQTRPIRVAYAKMCLVHFPRFVTGGYDLLGDTKSRTRTSEAAEKVVSLCEAMVDELQPLGNIASKYVTSATIADKSAAVKSDHFSKAFLRR